MLTNLINVAVAVNDMEAAIQRFEQIFGWTLEGEINVQPGLNIRTAMLKAGNTTVELLSPLPGETILRRFLETRGEGVYRLAFGAKELDDTLASFKANDVGFVDLSAAARRDAGNRIVFTHPKSAHGVMLEIVEGRE